MSLHDLFNYLWYADLSVIFRQVYPFFLLGLFFAFLLGALEPFANFLSEVFKEKKEAKEKKARKKYPY